jgi:hypothetical protein
VSDQPFGAVERARRLLATGEGELDGAPRMKVLLLEAHQGVGPNGGLRLVIDRAASIEIAVLLDQGEGVAGPVLALRFHHIDVREQQYRLELRVAAGIDRHEPAFLGVIRRREGMEVAIRKAR